MPEAENTSESTKKTILAALVIFAVIVLTATITYSISSNRYLDELDEQNQQIRDLQNVIRKTNGLPELEGTE